MNKLKSKEKGFTLLEIVIAMSLNVILLFGAIQTVIILKKEWLYHQALNRIQENARHLYLLLDEILSTAGRLSCKRIDRIQFKEVSPLIDGVKIGLYNAPIQIVKIKDLQSNPYLSKSFYQRLQPNSDILWIVGSKVPKNINSTLNRVLIIDDCLKMIAIINENDKTVEQVHVPFKYTNFRLLQSKLYYVGRTKRLIDNLPVYALYSTDMNGITQELIEGVESMKITSDQSKSNKLRIDFVLSSVSATFIRKNWTMEWHLDW